MNGADLIWLALAAPLVGGVGVALMARVPDVRETATVIAAIVTFIAAGAVALQLAQGGGLETPALTVAPGLDIQFRVEPLGAVFGCIAAGLWILNSLYSIGYMRANREKDQTRFYICFTIAISAALAVAYAANLFTLFIAYEVLTLSTYPLVAHKGDAKATKGARIYLLTLMATSIGLLLTAIVWTYAVAGTTEFVEGGILAGKVGTGVAGILLALYMFGIGKAALMPFHFWLPNAMVAPTPVSALLHAVAVVKAGVFTVLKVATYVFGFEMVASADGRDLLLGVACFTLVAASLIALRQDNLKSRLAYSTVSQLAYVTVGALLATSAAALGGGLQILMHAFGKITLFMCAGAIYVATGKTEVSQMTGLGRKMPLVFIAFLIGSLSVIGLPPFGGAWPKWELMQGAVDADRAWVVWALVASSLLNVAYLMPIAIKGLMPGDGAPTPPAFKRPGGAPALTVLPLCVTAAGCIVLFFAVDPIAGFLARAFDGVSP
jgi:multicomponent Na+:H+ antiporter subunit D